MIYIPRSTGILRLVAGVQGTDSETDRWTDRHSKNYLIQAMAETNYCVKFG